MGGTLKTASNWFCRNEPVFKVILIGESGGGRTTALYKMHLGEVVNSVPTLGFNVELLRFKGTLVELWDLGGATRLRMLWHHYV
jgi:GTPase SAR1 family protein